MPITDRFLKNPYYRMGTLAVILIFALGHWAYGRIAGIAPAGTRLSFFIASVVLALIAAVASAALGARYQRRLDQLIRTDDIKSASGLGRSSDEFSQLDRHVSGMARDLEKRVAQLEREKTRSIAMLENMREGLLVTGEDRRILLLNPAAGRILGVAPDRAVGRSLIEIARNADLESLTAEALASDRSGSREIRFFKPEERFLRVNAAPYRVASGERQAVLVFHDVTEMHRLENVRREFVANVSHELKTPLTSIQGFIETLLAGAWRNPEHTHRFLGMMDEDARRLSRLIHDLLDLSRIESDGRPQRRDRVDPGELVKRALAGLDPLIRQKKLTIENGLSLDGPAVEGDPGQIEQVFVNLLENAVKFTPEGGRILVRAHPEGRTVRFEITDTGIGIPEDALPRVFERFYRVDPARSREMGGTGLGLSIVKHIIESHGGSAGASSPGPGSGATFFFTLPLT